MAVVTVFRSRRPIVVAAKNEPGGPRVAIMVGVIREDGFPVCPVLVEQQWVQLVGGRVPGRSQEVLESPAAHCCISRRRGYWPPQIDKAVNRRCRCRSFKHFVVRRAWGCDGFRHPRQLRVCKSESGRRGRRQGGAWVGVIARGNVAAAAAALKAAAAVGGSFVSLGFWLNVQETKAKHGGVHRGD